MSLSKLREKGNWNEKVFQKFSKLGLSKSKFKTCLNAVGCTKDNEFFCSTDRFPGVSCETIGNLKFVRESE